MVKYRALNPKYRVPNLPDFEKYIETKRRFYDGWQVLYSFENHYGASIIQHFGSHGSEEGEWELAVFCDGELCYDTHITNDTIGHLKEHELSPILEEIKELPLRDDMKNPNEKPQRWIFTFAQKSEHKNRFAELWGTHDETREEMWRLFGKKWAFQCPSRPHAGVERYALEKLDLRDVSELDSEHHRKVNDAD